MCDELTPQQRLANIVAEETDGGRTVVRFFVKVAQGELDHEGFKPNHRMDAAKELVKVGLTEFDDYIRAGQTAAVRRSPRSRRPAPDPETEQARQELAQYARELTDDGRTVIRLYADVIDGLRADEGFKPHHRIAAGRELLKRGFDYECVHATSTVVPAKAGTRQAPGHAAPEARPEPDSTVIPAKAGIHTPELNTDDSELTEEYLESEENMAEVIEIVKRIAEQVTPEEREAHEAAWRGKDLSMWEIIEAQPPPVITKEQARIGAAKFHETLERWRSWDESDVKIPDPPEGLSRYDDR